MTVNSTSKAVILTHGASHWVTQLVSGEATAADARALTRWRQESPAHEAAFAEAVRVWQRLDPGARAFLQAEGRPTWSGPRHQMSRRMMLGGGGAIAAAAAFATVNPPLGLWPSLDEMRADYRTAKGEQRRVILADLTIQMNTQTSIAVPLAADGIERVTLIAGEASFTMPSQSQRSLTVLAGSGRLVASRARFDVRNVGSAVCITCAEGQVRVEHSQRSVLLSAGTQLAYDDYSLGQSQSIDAADATAWRDGFIVFRNTRLSEAVAEINRYRPGLVIVLNAKLQEATVSGRFRIERIDEILLWIEEVTGARGRTMPGGLVLLS